MSNSLFDTALHNVFVALGKLTQACAGDPGVDTDLANERLSDVRHELLMLEAEYDKRDPYEYAERNLRGE